MFLITAARASMPALTALAHEMGGKTLNSCVIVPWTETSEALASTARHRLGAGVIVSRLDDWTYLL